ncbi:MAG TPA: hypothetical protein VL284_08495, partial [Thermoanaerobaculia bacterium]|nr:hypothetical protein [Thermoanaerobaculia bacterium]
DSIAGIDLTVAAAPTDTNLACLHIGSVLGGETSADKNSISGAPGTVAIGQANDILFNGQASAAGQIDLPGYTGSTTDTTAVTNYLKAANTLADSPFVTFNQAVNNFHNSPGGADCAQPPLLFAAGGVERAAMPAFDTEVPLTRSAFRPNSMVGTDGLSRQQLDFIVEAARQRWIATGLTKDQIAALNRLRFLIDDLGGSYLGISDCDHVTLDRTAAGHGWFIDPTPSRDDEFGNHASNGRLYTDPYSAPAGHVDLLTAVMHEMGHDLGMPDLHESAQRDDIMYAELTVGERRLPRREDLRLVRTRSAADPDIRADAAPAAALTIHSSTTAPVANPIVGTPVTTPGTGSSHCPVFANGADGGG